MHSNYIQLTEISHNFMKTLSNIVAGTMNWGEWGRKLSPDGMARLVNACLESGIDSFDHADIYGGYTTEATFGTAIRQSKISRDSIKLISKCGIGHLSGDRGYRVKHYNYSGDYILWSVDQSLKNLQTDYLDVLLLHRPSPLMDPSEIAQAVSRLRHEGKILDFGVSNFTPIQADLINKWTTVSYNQISFSATHHQPMTDGTLDHMRLHEIRPMAWSPLGTVFKAQDEQSQRLAGLLEKLTGKYGQSASRILIAWIMMHPAKIIPVIGTADEARIRDLAHSGGLKLELQDWFEIWEHSRGSKIP